MRNAWESEKSFSGRDYFSLPVLARMPTFLSHRLDLLDIQSASTEDGGRVWMDYALIQVSSVYTRSRLSAVSKQTWHSQCEWSVRSSTYVQESIQSFHLSISLFVCTIQVKTLDLSYSNYTIVQSFGMPLLFSETYFEMYTYVRCN